MSGWEEHLTINAIIVAPIFLLLYWAFNINLDYLYYLIPAWFIFSILPDIDHAGSKVTGFLILGYIGALIFGVYSLFNSNVLLGIVSIITTLTIATYHFSVMGDGYNHRVFPHTFTFGAIFAIIFGLVTTLSATIFAFIFFALHLKMDENQYWGLNEILEYDKKVWNGDWGAIFHSRTS
jgi:hypothetical protein